MRIRIVSLAVVFLLFAFAVLFGVGYFFTAEPFDTNHSNIAEAVYAGLGIIFGVMVAQLVVAGWDDYQAARNATFREASALRNLARLTEGITPSQRPAMLKAAEAYARAVVEDEWPRMQASEEIGPTGDEALHDLFGLYVTAEMNAALGPAYLAASINKLENLSDARAERLAALRSGLPGFVWAALVVQATLFFCFVAFFNLESHSTHIGMVVALALTILLMLGLVLVLDNPFWPRTGIGGEDFRDVIALIRQEIAAHPETPAESG
jgi:predicted membrane chloride channel (bestrophin family)